LDCFVLLLAVAGKTGGAIIAARWTGQGWRASIALGALLNTRGLVELIVLNIAYNARGFFSHALYDARSDGAHNHGDDYANPRLVESRYGEHSAAGPHVFQVP